MSEATTAPRRPKGWMIAAGAAGVALVGALIAWQTTPADRSPTAARDAARLKRLPARPEDIEAHGEKAVTVLPPDDARAKNASVPFVAGPIGAARPFVFKGSEADHAQALQCLSTAVLYEAGDDTVGQSAVAQVVLNRVRHAAFPATVCGVVYQGSERATGCQFTFTCDGALRRQMPEAAWRRARAVAERALAGGVDGAVGLATHYHTDWVYPYWSPELNKLARVGTHLFFGWKGGWGGPSAFLRAYRGAESQVAAPVGAGFAMPSAAAIDTAAGEGPLLPGLPVPPAVLPAELRGVPLYGARVKLVRGDNQAFGLLAPAGSDASKLVNAALSLCKNPGYCQVSAWSNEDDIPAEYPLPSGAIGTMVFDYVRDGGGKANVRFDCRRYPNKDPKRCLVGSSSDDELLLGARPAAQPAARPSAPRRSPPSEPQPRSVADMLEAPSAP